MATFTSKTLIPGQAPVGQNKDGSYIYEEVMSKAPTTPKAVAPIYTPPTVIPMVKSPIGFNTMPQVNKEIAQKINAPVKDTLNIKGKINESDERVQQLQQHFRYLQDKGEFFLTDKQADYIKQFKIKNPDYENVPDASLYSKIILAEPQAMEKYGNIGEKTFLQRLRQATLGSITDTGEAIMEGVQAYKDYKPEGLIEQGIAATSGLGKFVGDFMNVGANLINLVTPKKERLEGTTSTSELLGKNVGEVVSKGGDIISSGIEWFKGEGWTEETLANITNRIQSDPEARKEFEAAVNILNILPLGFAGKTKKALAAKQVIRNIARDTEFIMGKKGVFGTSTKEAFDAGMRKGGFKTGLLTGARTTNEWLKKLPDETQKKAKTVEKNVNKNREVLEGIRNTQTGEKILSKADDQGFDPIDDVARYEELQPVIDSDGRIDTTQAIDNLDAFVETDAKTVRNLIEAEKKRVSFDKFVKETRDILESNHLDDPDYDRWLKYVDDTLESYRNKKGYVDENGTIALEKIDDIKKTIANKKVNYLNENDQALKTIAEGARKTIEKNVKNADIMRLNKELSRWYNTRDYLESIGVGKVIKGGRMGKYFAKLAGQGAGAIVGGAIGGSAGAFVGGVVGGEVADAIQGKILSGAIKKTGGAMPESELFGQARQTLSEGPKLLEGPSGKPTNYPSIYSREAGQLGRGEFPGNKNTQLGDFANPKEVIPVDTGAGKSLAISAENKTLDAKKLIEKFEQLTPEEKAKAKMASPRLAELVEINTEIKDIQEFKGDFGYTPPEVIQGIGKKYLNYSQEAKEMIRKGLDKDDLAELQKINRKEAGLPEPVVEGKVKVEKKPVDKKKKERQITSKGKLAFIDKYEPVSPNVGGEELYKIAKYFEDNNVEDLASFGDEPVLAGPSAKQRKRYATDVKAFEEHKAKVKEYAKQVETAAEDMGVDADTLFNDIKDRYNGIDTGDIKGGSMEDNIAMMGKDYEAQLEARRELQSLQDSFDTQPDTIDNVAPKTSVKAKLRTNEDALRKPNTILPGNNTKALYELANENPAQLKRMLMADGKIGSMQADDFIERAKLGKVRDDIAENIMKTPKSESAKVGETVLGDRKMFKKSEDTGGLYDFTGEKVLIDGKEVGGIKTHIKGDTLHIDNFFIKKDFQGQGKGKKVVQDLFKIFNDDYKTPIKKIEVSATEESKPFWEKIGGKVLGKQNPTISGGEYRIVIDTTPPI